MWEAQEPKPQRFGCAYNEYTDSGYTKDYDAVVTLRSGGNERTFALEYERTAKARKEYLQVRNDIEAETAVAKFLCLVPNYDLLSYIANFFTTSRRAIYCGLFPDFLNHLLGCDCAVPSRAPCTPCTTYSGRASQQVLMVAKPA